MCKHENFNRCAERIVATYQEELTRYACKQLNNDQQAAEDIVQETLMAGLPSICAGGVPHERAYLYRILNRKIWHIRRIRGKQGPIVQLGNHDIPSTTEDPQHVVEVAEQTSHAMSKLSDDDRQLIQERFFEGLTTPEMAERRGIALRTLQEHLLHAIARLREIAQGLDQPPAPDKPAEPADGIPLGGWDGHMIYKHPPANTGKQPFIRWNGHKVCFKRAEFDTMTRETAIAILRDKGAA